MKRLGQVALWQRNRPLGGDRGATAVEYALGVALLVIASLGSIEFLEDEAVDDFNDRAARSGAPDLAEGTDGGAGGETPGGGDEPDVEVPPEPAFFGGFEGARSSGKTSEWNATIEVRVVDEAGDGIDGARVTGTWQYDAGSGAVSIEVVCNQSNNQGMCRFQLSDLPAGAAEVIFTMTDISGGVPPVIYEGGPQVADPILKPTGGPK